MTSPDKTGWPWRPAASAVVPCPALQNPRKKGLALALKAHTECFHPEREKDSSLKLTPAFSRKYQWKEAAVFRKCCSEEFPEKPHQSKQGRGHFHLHGPLGRAPAAALQHCGRSHSGTAVVSARPLEPGLNAICILCSSRMVVLPSRAWSGDSM